MIREDVMRELRSRAAVVRAMRKEVDEKMKAKAIIFQQEVVILDEVIRDCNRELDKLELKMKQASIGLLEKILNPDEEDLLQGFLQMKQTYYFLEKKRDDSLKLRNKKAAESYCPPLLESRRVFCGNCGAEYDTDSEYYKFSGVTVSCLRCGSTNSMVRWEDL